MKNFLMFAGLVGLVAACGSSGGSATATGTVNGQSLAVKDAVFYSYTGSTSVNGNTTVRDGFELAITDIAGTCAAAGQSTPPSSYNILALGVTSSTGPIVAGSYQFGSSSSTSGTVALGGLESAANGASPTLYEVSSGSITITTLSNDSASGSYSVTLMDQNQATAGSLSGTFNATQCSAFASDDT